jgi:K+-transporting ATPase ATPase C chain
MFMRDLKRSAVVLGMLTVLTGVIYPLAVTGISRILFPDEAGGSLILKNGRIVGSRLIGQPFSSPEYFWGRPSSAGASGYDAAASSGSNDGPLHPALPERVKGRLAALRAAEPRDDRPVPADLVTSSGSGLDPHISIASALYQVPRVARSRGMDERQVRELVGAHTEGRQFGFLGEPRVNVLELNLALDSVASVARGGEAGR